MSEETGPIELGGYTTDKLVESYIALRDEKERIQKEFTATKNGITGTMDEIEVEFLKRLEAEGLEGLRTALGTVFKLPKTTARVVDWTAVINWVVENNAFDILTKNVSKDAVVKRINEDNVVVPGVDLYTFQTVGIRRA